MDVLFGKFNQGCFFVVFFLAFSRNRFGYYTPKMGYFCSTNSTWVECSVEYSTKKSMVILCVPSQKFNPFSPASSHITLNTHNNTTQPQQFSSSQWMHIHRNTSNIVVWCLICIRKTLTYQRYVTNLFLLLSWIWCTNFALCFLFRAM